MARLARASSLGACLVTALGGLLRLPPDGGPTRHGRRGYLGVRVVQRCLPGAPGGYGLTITLSKRAFMVALVRGPDRQLAGELLSASCLMFMREGSVSETV